MDRHHHEGIARHGTGTAMLPERFDFIDNMKAIGIALVVFGHAPDLGATLAAIIYSFHMPLFFFISGFLLKPEKLSLRFGPYLSTLWRNIMVPYLFFFIVSYLYWLPTHGAGSKASEYAMFAWYDPFYSLVLGYGHTNVALWFFTCLIMTSFIYYIFRRYFSEKAVLVIVVIATLAFVLSRKPSWPRLPWCLDVSIGAVLFYAIGHWARGGMQYLKQVPKVVQALVALAALAITIVCAAANGRVDLYELYFGNDPILFVPAAIAGIVFVLSISTLFSAGSLSRWLSRSTIVIFPMHGLMFSLFTGVGVVLFGLTHDFKESSMWFGVLYGLLALVLSYPTTLVIYRLFPFVIGRGVLYKKKTTNTSTAGAVSQPITTKNGVP